MHLAGVLILTCFVVFNCVVGTTISDLDNPENTIEDEATTEYNLGEHTFVALIDIVFTDNSKRTCTGTIIHDNVVITAAHCFLKEDNSDVRPELTMSFVVIGTKKMFDTGYEQYLPIERVITHPKFSGWTADICLVYTFAGMTYDKPGTIIPLAGEKTFAHVDSNVTVFSWGHIKEIDPIKHNVALSYPKRETHCPDSAAPDDDKNEDQSDENESYGNNEQVTLFRSKIRPRSYTDSTPVQSHKKKNQKEGTRSESKLKEKKRNKHKSLNMKLISRYLSWKANTNSPRKGHHHHVRNKTKTSFATHIDETIYDEMNYDVTTQLDEEITTHRRNYSVTRPELEDNIKSYYKSWETQTEPEPESDVDKSAFERKHSVRNSDYSIKSHYKNWRRQMGTQQNQLSVEVFGFINVQACKKLVERAMPVLYDISEGNDVLCYGAEDHFITDEDAGAPAVRHGHLVAMTVGGAELDGDHVAVGMKMSCYCSWIADNLPNENGSKLSCCKNCCDVKHKEEIVHSRFNDKSLL